MQTDFLKLKDDRKMSKNRIPLSPKIRFNILRRDGYACQYCGRIAPERELEVDHIIPVSKGGTNDEGNLQIACKECNRGKLADEILTLYEKNPSPEKMVIKEVIKYINIPYPNQNVSQISIPLLISIWSKDDNSPELKTACAKLIQASSDITSKTYSDALKVFIKIILQKPISKEYAINEIKTNGKKIREWSEQNDNLLLKELANECITIASKYMVI